MTPGLFLTPLLTLWGGGHCPSRMEVTVTVPSIIRRDLHTLSLSRDSPRDNQYANVM